MNDQFVTRLEELQGEMNDVAFAKKCGLRNTTMSMYRKGSKPSLDKAAEIAIACGVTLDWLSGYDELDDSSAKPNPELIKVIDIARQVLNDIAEAADPDLLKFDPEDFSKTFADILSHRLAIGEDSEKVDNIIEFGAARLAKR